MFERKEIVVKMQTYELCKKKFLTKEDCLTLGSNQISVWNAFFKANGTLEGELETKGR